MRPRLSILLSFLAAALLVLITHGCGGGGDTGGTTGGVTSTTGTTASGTGGAGGGGSSASSTSTTSATSSSTSTSTSGTTTGAGGAGGSMADVFVIAPLDPILLVTNANVPTQIFVATLNGQDVSAATTWVYDRPDIGAMAGPTFTPTGLVGGVGTLTATHAALTATTTITVSIQKTVDLAGVTQAQIDALDNPSGGPDSIALVYPFDQTVFPLGVLAPDVQWNGGAAGDLYRLHLKEKFYEYTAYFTTPAPPHFLMAEADWQSVESSGDGPQTDPLAVELQRWSNGQAFQPKTQTWHIALGRLHGSVYYWELPDVCGNGNGRILRIKPDSAVPEQFFTPGGCWGCHTVSRDGTKMMATLDSGSPFPQVIIDLAQNPAQYGSINPGAGNFTGGTFSAFNDKGDRVIVSNDGDWAATALLRILDAGNGQVLNPNAMGTMCGEPAWSPDGKKLAAICGLGSQDWIFDANQGYLATADVAADGFTTSNVQPIVPQAGAQGRPAYPSFSPGSEWIAYGRPTQGSRSVGNGDLWLVAPDGSGVKPLATASAGSQSFNPVFAPLRAGGYFWLVYISRRNYGNQLVGANRQQLWVTAIDDPPNAADPSHPPFYVRGQESCAKSENAYFALDPCKNVGADCVSGVDCCNGQCVYDPNSQSFVCGQPGGCSQDGNACTTAADCCNAPAVDCIDGFCQPPPHL